MIIFEPLIQLAVLICEYAVRFYVHLIVRPKVFFNDSSLNNQLKFKEPCIIIANHTTTFDPLLLMVLVKGKRNILVAKDWYEMPKFHWLLKRFHAIPINRFDPMDASWLSITKKNIDKGYSIIIFPEGKCREDGLLNEFKSGFAMLAKGKQIGVISIGIDGNYKWGHRPILCVSGKEFIERVKGVHSSTYLSERSEYFRQKVWNLKQQALGNEGIVLPIASETPNEIPLKEGVL